MLVLQMSTHPELAVEATIRPNRKITLIVLICCSCLAFFRAMATACFCGLPAFISVLMFELIVFREEPFLRGIDVSPASVRTLVGIHERRPGFKIRHDAFV